jgi:thioredoxin:protein disulfide reductase
VAVGLNALKIRTFLIVVATFGLYMFHGGAQAESGASGLSSFLEKLNPSQELLPAEKAFRFSARLVDRSRIEATWQIAPGYYLYREKFSFKANRAGSDEVIAGDLPRGLPHEDPEFGTVEIFRDEMTVMLLLPKGLGDKEVMDFIAGFQGCADRGVCYPPMKQTVHLDAKGVPPTVASELPGTPAPAGECSATGPEGFVETQGLSEQCSAVQVLRDEAIWPVILTFLGMGALLSLTPCVFPMIPILSGIIVGHGHRVTPLRGFLLSLSYVFASALAYMVFGVVAAVFGRNLQAHLQNPWVIGSFSGLFVVLGLSMFGFFSLEMPRGIQERLTQVSRSFKGGSYVGAAIMGALSSLIVGPCVAAPLAGILIYIGESGDAVLGGAALFALGMGMGAPLLLIGLSAGKLLPKAGRWMEGIKRFFGAGLLATALWIASRVLPDVVVMGAWGVFLVTAAVSLGALEPALSGFERLIKGLAVSVFAYGLLILLGLAQGSVDPVFPLREAKAPSLSPSSSAVFKRVNSMSQLDIALSEARTKGRPVLIDFYADWCVSCKEMDQETFQDPEVKQLMQSFDLLRIDVTENTAMDARLLQRFNLVGPPGIAFFAADGQEDVGHRVIGFMEAPSFLKVLKEVMR